MRKHRIESTITHTQIHTYIHLQENSNICLLTYALLWNCFNEILTWKYGKIHTYSNA